jgi:urea transport system ATP-binding protein
MLSIRGISSAYGETTIVRDIHLDVGKGQVVALMGRNGVGKTTLLKTLMGLMNPLHGKVIFGGQDITNWPPEMRAVHGIGYIPQGREIFPHLNVRENLLLGIEARKEKRGEIPGGIFELFPSLKGLLARKGGNLSGGEQQQLAIARVLITEPKLILMDEPTEGIQPSIVYEIENVIRFLKGQGNVSILLVEQFMEFALRLSDFCYIMEKGSIVFQGPVGDLGREEIENHLMV